MRNLLVIGALLATLSTGLAEVPANDAQNECATSAYATYRSKLQQRVRPLGSTIANVLDGRHLVENYCVQFVHCLDYPASTQGTMFQNCLDNEDADGLHDAWE